MSAYITHSVLSGQAVERVENSVLSSLVVTDSIGVTQDVEKSAKIRIATVAPLLGEAIKRISDEASVSSLFD